MRLLLSLAVMFVACAPVPRPTPEVMPEVAAQFGEIVNDWDEERMLALFSAERRTRGSSAATFTWLHAQLGECGAPEFMWSFANRGARFSYPCERGALEAGFMLDEAGKIVDVDGGAAGIPAPEALQSAAEAVLASLPEGVDTPRPFRHEWSSARKLGKCQIVRPWTVRELVAVFHSECETGEAALLSVRVDPDGTIAYASLVRSATIYHGPAVWLPESPARPASEALPEIAAEFGAIVNAWDR